MDRQSNVIDYGGTAGVPAAEAYAAEALLSSPFAGARVAQAAEGPGGAAPPAGTGELWLSSPFAEGLATYSEAEHEAASFRALVSGFEDEEFDEALQALADEAAARQLTATASWSSAQEAPTLAAGEAEAWMSSLAAEADRILAHLEQHFAERSPDSVAEGEIEAAAGLPAGSGEDGVGEDGSGEDGSGEDGAGPTGATEQFFRKLVKKVAKVAKTAARVVGKLHPLGHVFKLLRRLVRPLLDRVLKAAIGKLPPQVRPLATTLAARLTGRAGAGSAAAAPAAGADTAPASGATAAGATAPGDAPADTAASPGVEGLAEEFDLLLAEAVLAPNEVATAQFLGQVEAEEAASAAWAAQAEEPLAALDAARARLVRQLADAPPGEAPLEQVQQFIPVVMAAMPLIRLGLRLAGRERVVGFLADRLASLIKGHVGSDAARALARPIASAGLGLLGLEAEAGLPGASPAPDPTVGSEALVAALEDTVRQVALLPPESLADQLRLDVEVHHAFGEAVARHLPRETLRADLETFETAGEGGVWTLMPRATRPVFRYKKYSRVYPVLITRPLARAVIVSDGGTLERQLLDGGIRAWPVQAEVHLYEALPGTRLGHLAMFEVPGSAIPGASAALGALGEAGRPGEPGVGDVAAFAEEFEELTPQAAAVLTGEPGLGRPSAQPGTAGTPTPRPGQRFYRICGPGGRRLVRRRFRRLAFRLDENRVLRVHVRLSEREAGEIAGRLANRAYGPVVALFRGLLGPAARQFLTRWLSRPGTRRPAGLPLPAERSAALAAHIAEAVVTTVAKHLPAAAGQLAQAVRDPARGVTLTFAFPFADPQALANGTPGAPALTIRPGRCRD